MSRLSLAAERDAVDRTFLLLMAIFLPRAAKRAENDNGFSGRAA